MRKHFNTKNIILISGAVLAAILGVVFILVKE